MARYFLHLRDGTNELLDPEGTDCATMSVLGDQVLFTVRDLLMADLREGILDLRSRIDAENEHGRIVFTLPFKHAIKIIHDENLKPDLKVA